MKHFRVHHIMCTNLYQGYGYSGAFCQNMTKMVTWLKDHADEPLLLVSDPDEICKKCPNLVEGKYCMDDQSCQEQGSASAGTSASFGGADLHIWSAHAAGRQVSDKRSI